MLQSLIAPAQAWSAGYSEICPNQGQRPSNCIRLEKRSIGSENPCLYGNESQGCVQYKGITTIFFHYNAKESSAQVHFHHVRVGGVQMTDKEPKMGNRVQYNLFTEISNSNTKGFQMEV